MSTYVARMLRSAPDLFINRSNNSSEQRLRARRLEDWCLREGFRPSLLEVELERKRRREEQG